MTGRSQLIVATCSVVDALTREALLMIAFLQIKKTRWRLQFMAACRFAIKAAVESLEPDTYLVVPRLSVRAACRNHKCEYVDPKIMNFSITARVNDQAAPKMIMMARSLAEAWARVAFLGTGLL